MANDKSWAERHPVIFGALVGSVVPGIGTLAGALGGVIYSMTESNGKPIAYPANKEEEELARQQYAAKREKDPDEKH